MSGLSNIDLSTSLTAIKSKYSVCNPVSSKTSLTADSTKVSPGSFRPEGILNLPVLYPVFS